MRGEGGEGGGGGEGGERRGRRGRMGGEEGERRGRREERREKMKMGEDGRRQTGEWVEETQTVSHHGNLIYHHFYCLPSDLVL